MKTKLLFVILFVFLTSCRGQAQSMIAGVGEVRYMEFEGGFYGIVSDQGDKYYPLNLEEEYKKDGLRVSFEAVPADVMTIQMWGIPVEIKIIKLIEEKNSVETQ
ncbi:hypothetical protein IID04_06245 [PVC group bacterium]|nr:hypothetical protein [PVC group bacterium]